MRRRTELPFSLTTQECCEALYLCGVVKRSLVARGESMTVDAVLKGLGDPPFREQGPARKRYERLYATLVRNPSFRECARRFLCRGDDDGLFCVCVLFRSLQLYSLYLEKKPPDFKGAKAADRQLVELIEHARNLPDAEADLSSVRARRLARFLPFRFFTKNGKRASIDADAWRNFFIRDLELKIPHNIDDTAPIILGLLRAIGLRNVDANSVRFTLRDHIEKRDRRPTKKRKPFLRVVKRAH